MTKELRRLSIVILLMFITLFASTTVIQGLQADTLAANPENRRALYDSYEIQRGSIIVDGNEIASSTPSDDVYSFQRVYTDPQMWAPVTGWINPILGTRTGIEGAMNDVLSGTGGSQFFQRLDQLVSGQAPKGSNVVLSLSSAAQKAAYDGLTQAGYQGAVLAIEPSTGRILAMASTPSFDTNSLAVHNAEDANAAYDSLMADATNPLINRAINELNPPGSTFKLVVASAALSTGDYTPESTLPNPATYTYPDSTNVLHNASGGTCGSGSEVTIADALRLSCNIPFAELAVKLGGDTIRAKAEKFGFNSSFELPLLSTAAVYPSELNKPQTAQTGFGQFDVAAAPLQMAMVSAGIANGGTVMNPRMVDEVIGPDLSVQQTFNDSVYQQAIDSDIATTMTELMVNNVKNGVASGARIEGVDVAGKTGTAEHAGDDPYTLWFTGFAPAENPEVAVAVVVENGGGQGQSGDGNSIAAPIAKSVMEAVLQK